MMAKPIKKNPLMQLRSLGQSIWLDYIRRAMVTSGELTRLIEEDGLAGITSNLSIFEEAIIGTRDYDDEVRALIRSGDNAQAIYAALSRADVRMAADAFRLLYEKSDGRDGYVSLEVSPHLAHDTAGTLKEAHRLWTAIERVNVFIEVPATIAGLPVIEQLIRDGINVNVTLLFGLPRYRQVAEAYITGLEARLADGKQVNHVASVASFFLSRIDMLVDRLLDRVISQGGEKAALARKVHGQVATRVRKWLIRLSSKSSAASDLSVWPSAVATPSGCSGPARARKTLATAT